MTATTSFTCNICGEGSTRICARCTKDTCDNHLCTKCARCSDCCECELTRDESVRPPIRPAAVEHAPVTLLEVEMAPEQFETDEEAPPLAAEEPEPPASNSGSDTIGSEPDPSNEA